jgi:transcriptional regulator with XRE-family HTH domain
MVFDYSELLGRIKARGFTQETLAKRIKMAKSTMCLKLGNRAYFTQPDIDKICEALGIEAEKIGFYFFTPKVRKAEKE